MQVSAWSVGLVIFGWMAGQGIIVGAHDRKLFTSWLEMKGRERGQSSTVLLHAPPNLEPSLRLHILQVYHFPVVPQVRDQHSSSETYGRLPQQEPVPLYDRCILPATFWGFLLSVCSRYHYLPWRNEITTTGGNLGILGQYPVR